MAPYGWWVRTDVQGNVPLPFLDSVGIIFGACLPTELHGIITWKTTLCTMYL